MKRERAKELLLHYLRVASERGPICTSECYDEIEEIVDLIVGAAVEEVERRLLKAASMEG